MTKKYWGVMAKKKPNTSRLFQLALNDAIKSTTEKFERNTLKSISTKEMIPQTVELKPGIASKQRSSLVQQQDSTSSLPRIKDKPCQKTSQPVTDGIGYFLPVSLSMNSSNYSLTIKNPIYVQDCSNSIYALPICEPGNSQTGTDCCNPKWIDPPSCDPLTFCNSKGLGELYGDQPGCDLFPEHLIRTNCDNHFSKESKTVEWPLANELCSVESTIPAPKSADDFFNSSSYIDQVNALKYEGIPNPKSSNILSDSYLFGNQIGFQDDLTAIPSSKPCDNIPTSFTYVPCSTNKVLLPNPNGYDCHSNSKHPIPTGIVPSSTNRRENVLPGSKDNDCVSNSVAFSNPVFSTISKRSIPSPKSPNFFNSFPFSDEICLPNSGITIPSPKSYESFASSVPLTDKVCSANCDIVSAKQIENYRVDLNSNIYQSQMSTCRSNCSCTKCDWKAQYSGENTPKFCGFKSCNCNLSSCDICITGSKPSKNLCQELPILRDCEKKLSKNITCDNLFPNNYLDELIKMGSKDSDISRSENNYLEDNLKMDSKLLNFNDNATESTNKRNYEKSSHTFDFENQNLKPSSFENPSLVDFKETSLSKKSVIQLTDASMCNLDFGYCMNQSNVESISTVPHSHNHLDQLGAKQKIKSEFSKIESELGRTLPPFLGHFDLLNEDSTVNLTASEAKLTDNLKIIDSFEDKRDSVKDTNSHLHSFEFSTSHFSTSLDSLVDSNFDNSTDIVNITDCMSSNSCISNSTNSIDESITSEQICNSFTLDVFNNESKSNILLECNRSIGSSISKNNCFSTPSTSIDSGIEFLLEDALSIASLDKSSTCSEPELNVFSCIPKEKSSKLVCLDKNVINADCKAKYTATSMKFTESEVDSSDYLVNDEQRIDNLIAQFMGM